MRLLNALKISALSLFMLVGSTATFATNSSTIGLLPSHDSTPDAPARIPSPPRVSAKSYILIDAQSGKILAEKNADKRLPPASLTKMMTMYVISTSLRNGQITPDDTVSISHKAWKVGGSKMFVREGQHVHVKDLIKGIIVQSGNDACIAMAEHVAGNEKNFAQAMNQEAKRLGMNHSHFTDSTGLPHKNHYTTARDLAILARALVYDYPDDYAWYKSKWFKFNGIRQPNRNRLLWRDQSVDGIKTGHTDAAGYCLVASAQRDGMRLIAVVMGTPSDAARASSSQRLLNYGYRFYESDRLYKANQGITRVRVWQGKHSTIPLGVHQDIHVTIPKGQYKQLSINMETAHIIKAPISKGQRMGELVVKLNDAVVTKAPLYALTTNPQGSMWTRMKDAVTLKFKGWFGSNNG